eukprot:3502364-Prymnesium_polylepis.1
MSGGVSSFVLFSSVAALLGGAGQANYAAANTSLDALSACRSKQGSVSVSVQWGAWAEVGMASRGAASERMAAAEAASGFGRIGLAQGLAALAAATRQDAPSTMTMALVTWSKFLGRGGPVPTLLVAFEPTKAKAASKGALAAKDAAEAQGGVSLDTVLELARNTGGGDVDADVPLMEAGIDSLGAVELRNQLQSAVGSGSLPSTIVFDHPTARQLAVVLQPKESTKPAPKPVSSAASGDAASTFKGATIGGASSLFPAGAGSIQTVQLLVDCGRNVISEIPLSRWDVEAATVHLPPLIASRARHTGF